MICVSKATGFDTYGLFHATHSRNLLWYYNNIKYFLIEMEISMYLDILGLIGACSYALDCVEAELVHSTNKHSKRVAYMSVCIAMNMGINDESLQDLAACALMHDNALTQYIKEELHNNYIDIHGKQKQLPQVGQHCILGEQNIKKLPFNTDVTNVILYHHENADGSGIFGKKWNEIPLFSRIIHMCDILDLACCNSINSDKHSKAASNKYLPYWNKIQYFLENVRGRLVDNECIDSFLQVFTPDNISELDSDNIEVNLWSKVPRMNKELNFNQLKQIASFFAGIIDYKSPFTSTHSIGVACIAKKLAGYMGLGEETSQKIYLAGALHDIGKVAIGNDILEKPDKLTDEEYSVMKHHAAYTYYILSDINGFDEIRDWAAFHHERLDGSGYPFGKTAKELNIEERIMACADIYQALTESRPYKSGMPHNKACSILYDMSNKGWIDSDVVSNIDKCFANEADIL